MTFYYIINTQSGLVVKCACYRSAIRIARLIKGIIINARCPHAIEIVNQYRGLWNSLKEVAK